MLGSSGPVPLCDTLTFWWHVLCCPFIHVFNFHLSSRLAEAVWQRVGRGWGVMEVGCSLRQA